MVKVSYEQKPFRKAVMQTFDANVIPSPSDTTNVGRQILKENPGTTGSLGCAISEAVEAVSYTHLDVYKRQLTDNLLHRMIYFFLFHIIAAHTGHIQLIRIGVCICSQHLSLIHIYFR